MTHLSALPVSALFQSTNFCKLPWQLYRFEVAPKAERLRKRTVFVLCPIPGAAIYGVGSQMDESVLPRPLTPFESELKMLGVSRHVKAAEVVSFMNTMGKSLLAGVSMRDALTRCAANATTPYFRGVVGCMAYYTSTQGGELSGVMRLFPNVFSEMVTAQIEAGEQAGKLREAFELLAEAMKNDLKLTKKLKGIMVYPILLAIGVIGLFVLMQTFVIPRMAPMFTSQISSGLPMSTRIVMGTSAFAQQHWYVPLGMVGLVIYGLVERRRILAIPRVQRLLISVPGLGALMRYAILIRSLRALAMLFANGVPLNRAFEITARVAGHVEYSDYFLAILVRITSGEELDRAFFAERWRIGAQGLDVAQQIQIGVSNGSEGKAILSLVDIFETEIQVKLETLPTLINFGILLMVMPLFLLVALAIIQPTVQMATDTLQSMGTPVNR